MQGQAVGDAQQKLVELGYAIDHAELGDELFGPSTDAAVRAFQASQGLAVDGIAGPKTLAALNKPDSPYVAPEWRCEPSQVRAAVRRVIESAVGDIGVKEEPDGSNDGPLLAKFQTHGEPWCALACSYWYSMAEAGSPWGRMSATWDIYDWAKDYGAIVGVDEPVLPGDIAVILRANRRGHTMLVVYDLGADRLCTIAGNEGNAVRGGIRSRSALSAIIRPIRLP